MPSPQAAMQPHGPQVHDDLASLFSRSLNFNPDLGASDSEEAPPRQETAQPVVYSVSQHYHHSTHVVKQQPPHPPSSQPPQGDSSASEAVLRHHGIDAATLTPSQLKLFRVADAPQKRRLIDLWSICLPRRGDDIPPLAWSSDTLDHEEHLARMRLERRRQSNVLSLDGTQVQMADATWSHADSEPYVVSGYQELMRREDEANPSANPSTDIYTHFGPPVGGHGYSPATDPVYLGPDVTRQQMDMATQYGAFEHLRATAEADAMDVM